MSRLQILGQNIAYFRRQKGWSQEFLAEKADLSREYVTRVERGQKNISLKKLFLITDILDVKFSQLTNFD